MIGMASQSILLPRSKSFTSLKIVNHVFLFALMHGRPMPLAIRVRELTKICEIFLARLRIAE